eukprot:1141537-Pelagomonas_calceolata.AAC.4
MECTCTAKQRQCQCTGTREVATYACFLEHGREPQDRGRYACATEMDSMVVLKPPAAGEYDFVKCASKHGFANRMPSVHKGKPWHQDMPVQIKLQSLLSKQVEQTAKQNKSIHSRYSLSKKRSSTEMTPARQEHSRFWLQRRQKIRFCWNMHAGNMGMFTRLKSIRRERHHGEPNSLQLATPCPCTSKAQVQAVPAFSGKLRLGWVRQGELLIKHICASFNAACNHDYFEPGCVVADDTIRHKCVFLLSHSEH